MEALVFFLGEQNEKIEEMLTTHLDKTYEKYVPQQVRKFVDSQIAAAQEEAPARAPRAESETVAQENEAAQSVAEPEEMPGMSMGM